MVYKKFFIEENSFISADYVRIIELHVVHTSRHMQMSRWNKGLMISIKKINKNLNIFKK